MDSIFHFLTSIGLSETNIQFMLVAAILGISIYVTLYGGMFSLANAGFMSIGAFTSVILSQQYDWPFLQAILGGMMMAGLIAIPIGLPVLRLNDIYLAIATIGFGEIVAIILQKFDKFTKLIYEDILHTEIPDNLPDTGGARGLKGIPVLTETWHLVFFLVIVAYFLYQMHRSRFGRALSAIRQDANVAASMGIHVVYYKNMAFIIGAIIAGGAGALSGHMTHIVTPSEYGFNRAVDILTYAVLGGTSSFLGLLWGGMTLKYLPELLRRVEVLEFLSDIVHRDLTENRAAMDGVINGIVLILVIVYLPGGIADPKMWQKVRDKFQNFLNKQPDTETLEKGGSDEIMTMLELQKVSRQFGGLAALTRVEMQVPDNKIVGLIGPNGTGKTTLINCISGLDHPTSGVICFNGKEVQQKAAHVITCLGMARTYQNIRLFGDMTVLENVIVAGHGQGKATLLHSVFHIPSYHREEKFLKERALQLLKRFHLLDRQDVPAANLSYGDQRRLEMARALATSPTMILLDEPTAGMNPTETQELGEQILRMKEEDNLTLLVVEHDMSLISQVCDEVYVLNFGEIIAHGTTEEVRRNPDVIEAYLGEEDNGQHESASELESAEQD